MTHQSPSRTVMVVFTAAAMVALATVARTAGQGNHSVATGSPCPLDPTLTCVMTGLDSPRGLAFGPEGGWTESELKLFHETGWKTASLGSTILRAETAVIAAAAITLAELQ